MKLHRAHHQAIWNILEALDGYFLAENNILFGGGTRIAMELGEYRESVDIDLLCVGKRAYKAARSAITQTSFGPIFQRDKEPSLYQGREIRADRDAVRSIVDGNGRPIKLELIHFDEQAIIADTRKPLFPVPCLAPESCFATKLLANADRYRDSNKDLIDLCMMRKEWGDIPQPAWQAAFDHYGENVVLRSLRQSLALLTQDPEAAIEALAGEMGMEPNLASGLVKDTATTWLHSLN
ncbi:MAG: nucleotidyl transferase AbiEii/AbiGii toxin family protein [Pseudomonadales bacterium]|nr:nucleotidyl transferase AbiEii/AbiGii toxin family protein [Pseudomonadales bacterium]